MANSLSATNFVGVIDSGVGGLTVLKDLQEQFPQCAFVYLADGAFCPYGVRPLEQIFDRVCVLVEYLAGLGASAIVLACNTASVFADRLREKYSVPIHDVILPTCKVVAETTVAKRGALLATNATVKSGVYKQYLNDKGIIVFSYPCSSFVPFVESNTVDSTECDDAIQVALQYLPRANVDVVILGCTHFPVIKNKIAPYANGAKIIQCSTDFHPIFTSSENHPKNRFFTTGVEKNATFASQWYGKKRFEHLDL